MVLLGVVWQEAESGGQEGWSIDDIHLPHILECRVVTHLAVVASPIFVTLPLKKMFLLPSPSTLTQTGWSKRKCQERWDEGQSVQNQHAC